jgi:3-oxoacyl-ACP reductase-like protein
MRRNHLLISSALALSLVTLAGVSSAEEGAAPAPAPAPAPAATRASAPASEDGPTDH